MLSIVSSAQSQQIDDYLASNSQVLQTSLQRLSSGLRINGAADDAAGLTISQSMRGQIDGFNQAARNAQSMSNLIQTAEGGLAGTTEILQRIRTLSVQAASDSLTASDRAAIQTEVSQMLDSIDQIASDTQFNSIHVLDGSTTQIVCQTGANAGQLFTLLLANMSSASLGLSGSPGTPPITVTSATPVSSVGIVPGVLYISWKQPPPKSASITISAGDTFGTVFSNLSSQGVTASVSGNKITLSVNGNNLAASDQSGGNFASVTNLAGATNYKIGPTDYLTSTAAFGSTGTPGTSGISELSSSLSSQAISAVDGALTTVLNERSQLGALQNQLDAEISNLSVSSTNAQAAESNISDTNVAIASQHLIQAQIAGQSGRAMLSQANFSAKVMLGLLNSQPVG